MSHRLLLIAAVSNLLWGSSASGAPATTERRPFVRVAGTRFVLGDAPFYFVGANLNVMHDADARARAEETIVAAARDGLTVGRVWALGEGLRDCPRWKTKDYLFRCGPDGWHEAAFLQLDRVVALAAKHGLRLIVTLSNQWTDYGGAQMYLRWAGDRYVHAYGYSDRFFANPRAKAWFADHVRRIVGRVNSVTGVPYRDDPTIFAWELQNEMRGTPEAAATRRAWTVEMARLIRGIDREHLIVPGQIGYDLTLERENWIAMCRLPEVAYCDQHIYPEERLRSGGARNLARYIDDRVQLAHHVIGKPIVFGEFGFADRGPARRRAASHQRFLERVFYDGGNGALVWIYQPTLSWERRFGVLIDKRRYRPLRRALSRVARRIARATPRARNPILGPERGERPIAPTHALKRGRRAAHRRWRADVDPRVTDAASSAARARRVRLRMPVEGFHRAYFEEAGSWDGGVLVHAYGRRTGWIEYRFVGPRFVPRALKIRARLSSEFPAARAPKDGHSRVQVSLAGTALETLTVDPDDGVGRWYEIEVADPALLRRIRRRAVALRFEVVEGPSANGVAIYGRETSLNREPVAQPAPLTILAER